MTVLPIVERELRVASRQRLTHRIRLFTAFVALVIGGFVMLNSRYMRPHETGMTLFICLTILAGLYSVLCGVITTSDCLSQEKRQGTLGLLFLTDLKGYDIIAGKLVATSLNVFYGVLAIFPIMAIPLLTGGVTGGEFWRIVLSTVNTLFFSLSVGMWVSSISKNDRRAIIASFFVLLFFTGGLPGIGAFIADAFNNSALFIPFAIPSPGFACYASFDASRLIFAGNDAYLWSVGCIHLMGWLFLIASSIIVPHTWKDRPANSDAADGHRYRFWERVALGNSRSRPQFRHILLQINPFYWLTARNRLGIVWLWATLAVGALIWLWGYSVDPRDWSDEVTLVLFAIVYHLILRVWLASDACRRFATDRADGALELLLVTPLTVPEIIRGQITALRRHFLGPTLVILLFDFVILITGSNQDEWYWLCICGMIIFVADIIAITWVGMWTGLNSRNTTRATLACLVRILVLPSVILMTFWLFIAFNERLFNFNGPEILFLSWLLVSLAVDLFFGLHAARDLHDKFRQIATQRFEQKKSGTHGRL